jgi:HEAT repeat protein
MTEQQSNASSTGRRDSAAQIETASQDPDDDPLDTFQLTGLTAAAEALDKIETPLEEIIQPATKEAWLTSDYTVEEIYRLVAMLVQPEPPRRPGDFGSTVMALVDLGPAAVEPLIAALRHPHALVRAKAANALGGLQAEQAVAPLLALQADSKSIVRQAALQALEQYGLARLPQLLLGALSNLDPRVRVGAIAKLADLVGAKAGLSLLTCLADSHPAVRAAAVRAVGRLALGEALEPLIRCLYDPIFEVRWAAVTALGQLGDPAAFNPVKEKVQEAALCYAACITLLQLDRRRAIEPLRRLLAGPDQALQLQALLALKSVAGEGTLVEIEHLFHEPQASTGRERDETKPYVVRPILKQTLSMIKQQVTE